jgi:uncharacterized protein YbjQ (UPF0145 family)
MPDVILLPVLRIWLVVSLRDMRVVDLKSFMGDVSLDLTPKMFVGEVRSFETLQTRARREAVLRLMEQAHAEGYNAIANLRLESADIGGNVITNRKSRMIVTSMIASGTAYKTE